MKTSKKVVVFKADDESFNSIGYRLHGASVRQGWEVTVLISFLPVDPKTVDEMLDIRLAIGAFHLEDGDDQDAFLNEPLNLDTCFPRELIAGCKFTIGELASRDRLGRALTEIVERAVASVGKLDIYLETNREAQDVLVFQLRLGKTVATATAAVEGNFDKWLIF
jgi:hypothetical protein